MQKRVAISKAFPKIISSVLVARPFDRKAANPPSLPADRCDPNLTHYQRRRFALAAGSRTTGESKREDRRPRHFAPQSATRHWTYHGAPTARRNKARGAGVDSLCLRGTNHSNRATAVVANGSTRDYLQSAGQGAERRSHKCARTPCGDPARQEGGLTTGPPAGWRTGRPPAVLTTAWRGRRSSPRRASRRFRAQQRGTGCRPPRDNRLPDCAACQ
ncbi:hypothetical protein BH10PSE1_BH10PSE1_25200 [soil metagenome]